MHLNVHGIEQIVSSLWGNFVMLSNNLMNRGKGVQSYTISPFVPPDGMRAQKIAAR